MLRRSSGRWLRVLFGGWSTPSCPGSGPSSAGWCLPSVRVMETVGGIAGLHVARSHCTGGAVLLAPAPHTFPGPRVVLVREQRSLCVVHGVGRQVRDKAGSTRYLWSDEDGNLPHLFRMGHFHNVWLGWKFIVNAGTGDFAVSLAQPFHIIGQSEVAVHDDVCPIVALRGSRKLNGSSWELNDVGRRFRPDGLVAEKLDLSRSLAEQKAGGGYMLGHGASKKWCRPD